jgi:hypothetical protein
VQIIVLGMHRSGTSMAGRLLNLMGCYFAEEGSEVIIPAKDENPKGFWERRDVVELNDGLIEGEGAIWDCPLKFDTERIEGGKAERFAVEAKKVVEEMDGHGPWFLKDPRFCLTLPMWRKVLEGPIVVHVFRAPLEVAMSFRKRNGASLSAGLALWEYHVLRAVEASRGLPCLYVRHDEMIRSPKETVRGIYEKFGELGVEGLVEADEGEVAAFVDASLYRNRAADIDEEGRLSETQRATWAYLVAAREGRAGEAAPEVSEDATMELDIYEKGRWAMEAAGKMEATAKRLEEGVEEREELRAALRRGEKAVADLGIIEKEIRGLEAAGKLSSTRLKAALRLLRTGTLKRGKHVLARHRDRLEKGEGGKEAE